MLRLTLSERPWFVAMATIGLFCGALLLSVTRLTSDRSLLCSITASSSSPSRPSAAHLDAILHYATSRIVPQQSNAEIRVSYDVLRRLGPCNFLVFGLGHDSIMWSSFNDGGTTLFLEEDPSWVRSVLKDAPFLRALSVSYPTRLSDADSLLSHSRSEPSCRPSSAAPIKANRRCKLALADFPAEVHDSQWDLIMIDAPRGYAPDLPGRMAAIFSAAVMARSRKGGGVTHVFLHDVDRRVEKLYAEEFLCLKYRVAAVGRLWHFEIPPAENATSGPGFC